MNNTSMLLVIFGLFCQLLSVVPAYKLCRHKTGQTAGWNAIYILILFFICGYSFFLYHLVANPAGLIDLILAVILSSGGVFVVLVVRMSLASIEKLNSIALENEHHAMHDSLTGLANRKSLYIALENTIAAQGRSGGSFAVLVMDLNGFKEVNDSLGHCIGDVALQEVSQNLAMRVRASDRLFRMGGDEFAAIIPHVDQTQAEVVAHKLAEVSEDSLMVESESIKLGISIGIALYPLHGSTPDELIQSADVAMYYAKNKNLGVSFFNDTFGF